jgi:hypothetical protein
MALFTTRPSKRGVDRASHKPRRDQKKMAATRAGRARSRHNAQVTDNPFAVLTAVVAPAILTNACSVLALGTSNRVARVVDRTRVVSNELVSMKPGSDAHRGHLTQIERLRTRSRLLITALRIIYAALGGFAACALISVIGAIVAYYDSPLLARAIAAVALLTGMLAVAGLVAGCATMVAETRLALDGVQEAADDALAGRAI